MKKSLMPPLSFVLFFAFSQLLSFISQAAPAPLDRPKVLAEIAQLKDDKKNILVPAKVEAKIQSGVSADVEGHVVQILKPLGAVVKAGEIVLYLENKDPGFTYAKVPVRSPIAGVVSQFQVAQMSKVSRGDKLFTVINPKALKLTAEFSSLDAEFIKAGSQGVFKAAQSDTKPVRIVGLSPLVDPRTGTASAELEFVGSAATFPAIGTIGQVNFEINMGQVMLVPENSLIYRDGKPLIRVITANNQIEKKPIVLGEQRDSLFVIKSGLKPGEKIVLRSSRAIKDGEEIDVENGAATEKK